jgi:hypothetical protein
MKVILSLTSSSLWQKLYPNINAIHVESLVSINSMPEGLILVTSSQDICDGVILELLEDSEEITIFYQQAEYWIGQAISHSEPVSVNIIETAQQQEILALSIVQVSLFVYWTMMIRICLEDCQKVYLYYNLRQKKLARFIVAS